jgi:putative hemolysin
MGLLARIEQGYDGSELLQIQLALFQTKKPFRLDLKKYSLETANTRRDLLDLIELRNHSFFEEFGMNESPHSYLFDRYDQLADHILLRNKETGDLIASYRILCSDFVDRFYSEEQYDLNKFLRRPGRKIELSRACVHKDHRNGITLSLIWKGLAQYASLLEAKMMFGCASVKSMSPRLASSMHWHLHPFHLPTEELVPVLDNFKTPNINTEEDLLPFDVVKEQIPPLLKSYLKAGAKIGSEPALDRVFRCFDFFTVLDLEQMNGQHRQRYF